jgi:hypothetical protein
VSQESSSQFRIKYENHGATPSEVQLQKVFERATPETVPTGILYRTSLNASPLAKLDGGEDSMAIGQADFEILLDELRDSRLPAAAGENGLAGSSEARRRSAAHRDAGLIPIFVAAYDFHAVRNRVWLGLERLDDNGEARLPWDEPAQLFEQRRAFLAAAMMPPRFAAFSPLPHVHFGQQVRFVVPSDGLLGNGPAPHRLRADFGDGLGFREVVLDQPVEVSYSATGDKTLAIEGLGAAGDRAAHFRITIAENIVDRLRRDYDVSFHHAEGRIPRYPQQAKAEGLLFKQKGAPITRPVLLVEGFPFNYSWDDIFKYADQQGFATGLVARGHAVMLVRFTTGPREIQASAYALVEMIKLVIGIRVGSEKLVIGGFSMGGLVARYALAGMEHPRWGQPDHQVGSFFTVDTPHEGANVSVAVQAFAQVEDPGGAQAELLRSPAAQQVLLSWVPAFDDWHDGREFGAHGLRVQLMAELRQLGGMPQKPDTIAIANGAGSGKFNQAEPGSKATHYRCGKAWAYLYFVSRHHGGMPLSMCRRYIFDRKVYRVETVANLPGYDSIPGGIWEQPIFARVHDRTAGASERILDKENGAFIPTVSALGIKVDNYFRPLTLEDLKSSYFKKVTYHQGTPDNEVHIRLTPQLTAFLREQVFNYKAVEGEEVEPAEALPALSAAQAP